MRKYLIEVLQKKTLPDPFGRAAARNIDESGIAGIGTVRVGKMYRVEGALSNDDIVCVAGKLLADPVTEEFTIKEEDSPFRKQENARRIEVWFHPCVTDTVSETVKIGIDDLGITGISHVATGRSYMFRPDVTDEELKRIAHDVLANSMINKCVFY